MIQKQSQKRAIKKVQIKINSNKMEEYDKVNVTPKELEADLRKFNSAVIKFVQKYNKYMSGFSVHKNPENQWTVHPSLQGPFFSKVYSGSVK